MSNANISGDTSNGGLSACPKVSETEEDFYKILFEYAPDAYYLNDLNGVLLGGNRAAEALLGYQRAELIGKSFAEAQILPPDQVPLALEMVAQNADGLPAGPAELRLRRKDGVEIHVEVASYPVRIQDRIVVLGNARDISARKARENRLRRSEAGLRLAQRIGQVGSWELDLQTNTLEWSEETYRIFGCHPASFQPAREAVHKLIHPDDLAGVKAAVENAIASGKPFHAEHRIVRPDGTERVVSQQGDRVLDEQGLPWRFVGVVQDITERKKLEAQLLRSQRLESIGHLASGIAHDLNNILMPITMVLPMVREQVTDQELVSLLETVEGSAHRGASIVKQVLTFARGLRAEKTTLQPAEMLAELAIIIREAFPRAISIKCGWPKQLWPISGDFTQVHQVLMNLCVNARDAMPEGGTLTLAAENVRVDDQFASTIPEARPGDYVVVLVADTGTGIAPEHLDHIFDPFFTTKEVGKGTGLGLSTTLGILRSHGGFIRVESKPGRGTHFRIYLPAVTGDCTSAEPPTPPLPQGRGELILVVDDEESIRVVVRRILERNGYRVLVASEGAEAVMLFSQHAKSVAAVLTDLMMPQMSGVTLIRMLQKISPQLKVLVATGLETSPEVSNLAALGVQTVLPKPFTPRTLLEHLRVELDRC